MRFAEVKRRARPFFHWSYSGVFIPLFFGVAFTLVEGTTTVLRFALAYTCFALGGVWGVCYWFTSDWLSKLGSRQNVREIKRNSQRLDAEKQKFVFAEFGFASAILFLSMFFVCVDSGD
jgi:hypothetical protein